MKDLIEDSEYEYRILAENEAGISKPSPTTGIFKARDPYERPGKPGQPDISDIQPESVQLAWTAPAKDGRSPITNYIVESKEVGEFKVHNM